ncbi:PBSX family phage terminase large subunit [Salinicoccus sp. HZC-1]|uniref:PBSX family phage terminase large subunit n=1 Tax=Salinicoccus sp. HZC-1 TaxID=3385497 RepID=UPI00398B8AFD
MTEAVDINVSEVIGKGYNRFWHNKSFYRVVKGSRGSKKSKTTAINFLYRLMRYEWANLLVIRRYSNTNRQSTYTDFKWAANRLKVAHLFKFNDGTPEITYVPTGQKILFRGLDDPLKITSISVDVGVLSWAWFEEAYQIENQEKFDTVVESIRGRHESPEFFKQVTVTFNPWSERHWLKRAFFDVKTRFKDVFAITTTYRVNEWLDKVDIDRLEDLYRTNPRRARIVCDGEWGVAEGLVFDNHKVIDFDWYKKFKEIQEKAHGMDYGFTNDPTTLSSTIIDVKNKKLYIYDEHYEKAMYTDEIYDMVINKGLEDAEIIGDGQEKRLISELRRKGLKGLKASIKGPDSIRAGVQFVQGFEIIVHPSCVNTIEELNTYVFQQDNEGNWLNKPEDKNNHLMDALRYSLEKYHLPRASRKKGVNANAVKSITG